MHTSSLEAEGNRETNGLSSRSGPMKSGAGVPGPRGTATRMEEGGYPSVFGQWQSGIFVLLVRTSTSIAGP